MTKKKSETLNYLEKPLSEATIDILYLANHIKYEKCELYGDFVESLVRLIFDTYMGDDITDLENQKNHFNWCWKKNIENFEKEGIKMDSVGIYNYFYGFMFEIFYPLKNKDEYQKGQENILKLWSYIFDCNRIKNKSDMNTMIEVYKIFEISLKNDK